MTPPGVMKWGESFEPVTPGLEKRVGTGIKTRTRIKTETGIKTGTGDLTRLTYWEFPVN